MSDWVWLVVSVLWMAGNLWVFWKFTYPALVESHRWYQGNRLADGWTLPRFLCWLWWLGFERAAPPFLRKRQQVEETA